jgi:hypothetical protein
MKTPKKLSEHEIDRDLIQDAENPDAWEAPITVTPIRSRHRSSYREEIPTVRAEKPGVSKKQNR